MVKNLYKLIIAILLVSFYLPATAQKRSTTTLWNNLLFGGGKILVKGFTLLTTDSVWLALGFIDVDYRKTVAGDSLVLTTAKRQKMVLLADSATLPELESVTLNVKTWIRWYYFKLHKSELEALKNTSLKKMIFYSQPYAVEKDIVRDRNLDDDNYKQYLKNADKSRVVKFNRITSRSKKRFNKLIVELS